MEDFNLICEGLFFIDVLLLLKTKKGNKKKELFYFPSTKILNVLIHSLCRQLIQGRSFNCRCSLKCLPDVVTYNTLISGYCNFIGLDEGHAITHRKAEAAIKPDVITYNTLIGGARKYGLPLRALDLFDEMHQRRISPYLWSYLNGLLVGRGRTHLRESLAWS